MERSIGDAGLFFYFGVKRDSSVKLYDRKIFTPE